MSALKKIRHNEYFKSAVVIIAILGLVLGFFFGLQIALNTSVPVRVVESGSMCVPYSGACDGWTHPFEPSLHVGDIIIIQGVDPKELNTNYPYSDIIVYQKPNDPSATPIVHRIVAVTEVDGKLYFQTKGDGNGQRWPAVPSPVEYDSQQLWHTDNDLGVPQELVVGRVVMRIPYFGWITLFLRENNWGLPVIVGLILLLIVIEFVLPALKKKEEKTVQTKDNEEIKSGVSQND